MRTIAVIGGGAAGMMAAIMAAENGACVHLFEKNEKTGKKLFITGKGRCNVTNGCDTNEELLAAVVTNRKFLYSAFSAFNNKDMIEFLENRGLKLKEERGKRIFPLSDHSSDVIACLNREIDRLGVNVHLQTEVTELLFDDKKDMCADSEKSAENEKESRKNPGNNTLHTIIKGIRYTEIVPEKNGDISSSASSCEMRCDAVIIACGGLSYPSTGSTGDGYRLARTAGHTVTKTSPALVPMVTKEEWCRSLMGLSLKNIGFALRQGKKKIYDDFGEMLFTHFGISGPVVLSGSSFVKKYLDKGEVTCFIDLKPALSEEVLDARILRDFDGSENKQIRNALVRLMPQGLIPVVLDIAEIDKYKSVNAVTRNERQKLVKVIKALPLTVTALRGFNEAIITQGGISVKQIDPKTMESKLIGGLYFAGEVIDLDAVTGGFNLQIAWSTGFLAGISAAQ